VAKRGKVKKFLIMSILSVFVLLIATPIVMNCDCEAPMTGFVWSLFLLLGLLYVWYLVYLTPTWVKGTIELMIDDRRNY